MWFDVLSERRQSTLFLIFPPTVIQVCERPDWFIIFDTQSSASRIKQGEIRFITAQIRVWFTAVTLTQHRDWRGYGENKLNEPRRQTLERLTDILAISEACKAMVWPTAGFMRESDISGVSEVGDRNLCVRCILWGDSWRWSAENKINKQREVNNAWVTSRV